MPPRAEYITAMSLIFKTPKNPAGLNGDDKDDDTVITATVVNGGSAPIGVFKGYGGRPDGHGGTGKCNYKNDDTCHSVAIPVPAQLEDGLVNSYFNITIRIDVSGSDTWVFQPMLVVSYEVSPQRTFMPPNLIWQLTNLSAVHMEQFFPATPAQISAYGTMTMAGNC